MSKKTRGPNFCANEKEILIHLVSKHKDIVENKKTDAVTTNIKNEGWRKLTEEFNSMSSFCVRNTDQLRTCWDNIKRNTRKDKATAKKETLLTGGGRPNLPPQGPFQDQVEVLLGPTLDGLQNDFDSDAQFIKQDVANIIDDELVVIEDRTLPDELAGPSGMCLQRPKSREREDISLNFIPENELDQQKLVPEDKAKKVWSGWSPAALKSKVSDTLVTKKIESSTWLHRRRPKASVHDKLLQSKIELVEILKKNAENEAEMKQLILLEQLKQEKIKTETLQLQLKNIRKD